MRTYSFRDAHGKDQGFVIVASFTDGLVKKETAQLPG
jgi:hypothetical protein